MSRCKAHLDEEYMPECEACELEEKAEMDYWFQLYQGEKQAGLIPDPNCPPLPDPRTKEYWGL